MTTIQCPYCGSRTWSQTHTDIVDPARDRFSCAECGRTFNRYDKPTRSRQSHPAVERESAIACGLIRELVYVSLTDGGMDCEEAGSLADSMSIPSNIVKQGKKLAAIIRRRRWERREVVELIACGEHDHVTRMMETDGLSELHHWLDEQFSDLAYEAYIAEGFQEMADEIAADAEFDRLAEKAFDEYEED